MPKVLPILVQLPRIGPCECILSQLLPVLTEGAFVLPHILTIRSDVAIVVLKVAAIVTHFTSISAEILPVLSHIAPILAGTSLWRVTLGKDRTATQHRYRETHL